MQNLILVDTSAWICFFGRKGFFDIKESISRLLDENRVAIAGPIAVELIQGARTEKEKYFLESRIAGLHWLTITDDHWHEAADLSFGLRRKGITVSVVDILLAVVAVSYKCKLLHRDSDFDLIATHAGLRLYK
jgi:predicted nucleic acid-binding protein